MVSSSSLDSSYILVGDEMPQSSSSETVVEKAVKINREHPSTSSSYIPGTSKGYAHEWSGSDIRISGRHFVDRYGRVCNLRGVNLSGSCKSPTNHDDEIFPSEAETVTFVGRPFPLEEAHEHFSRLRRWGFTFIRFLVTWEAVEHAGPGIYDMEYLAYLRNILGLLPQYGMIAFVALHQDVWSRYSGGSGAPAWTLEYVGFDLHELEPTGAAWLKGVKGGGHIESERGLWPCGYQKLAASTMATVFWAGDTFAPKLTITNHRGQQVTAQELLQNAFIEMSEVLVKTVGDLEAVIGFEMMNEPHRGYIDLQSLHGFDYNTDLHLGSIPTAFESFQLSAGHPTTVAVWTRSFPMPTRKTGQATLNTEGRKVWRSDGPTQGKCIWEMHGVWGWCKNKDEAVVLRENYFVKHPMTGAKIDWYTDFYYPFLKRWTERIRSVSSPEKIVFVEVIPNEFCPATFTPEHQPSNMVYAPHWYDLRALFEKGFGDFTVNVQGLSRGMFPLKAFYWGQRGVRDNYALQIRNIVESGYKTLGEKPVIIGECGVPMDMNKGEAFDTDDFTWQARMMDALITALDRALVGFTLWNYNPYNTDSAGDFWNGENFSWFSRGRALPPFLLEYQQTAVTLDNGGRILPVIVRPYPAKTAGVPIKFEYEVTEGRFVFEWANPSEVDKGSPSVMDPPLAQSISLRARETEIYVPHSLTQGRKLVVSGLDSKGYAYRYDEERQTLFIVTRDTTPGKIHRVEAVVTPKLRRPVFWVNHFWGDWGNAVIAVVVGLLGIVGGIIMLLVMRP